MTYAWDSEVDEILPEHVLGWEFSLWVFYVDISARRPWSPLYARDTFVILESSFKFIYKKSFDISLSLCNRVTSSENVEYVRTINNVCLTITGNIIGFELVIFIKNLKIQNRSQKIDKPKRLVKFPVSTKSLNPEIKIYYQNLSRKCRPRKNLFCYPDYL